MKVVELLKLKLKFALSSSVATIVDNVLYNVLVSTVCSPEWSNVISYSTGAIINFIIQKNYVFDPKRRISTAFVMSMLVSLGGLGLSTYLIHLLTKMAFFSQYQFLAKLVVTGVVFFYNFFLKRYAFEKRFL